MYHNYKSVERVKPGGLELKDSLVGVQRVTKVTKGGRTFGFSAENPNVRPPLVTLVTLWTPTKLSLSSRPPGFTLSTLL